MLSLLFVFLFQYFYYIIDFSLLYLSSKVIFPLVSVVIFSVLFGSYLYVKSCFRNSALVLFVFVYLVVQSALASWVFFGQNLLVGLIGQVKLVPFLFYFLALWIFFRKGYSWDELRLSLVGLAWLSLFSYFFLEFFVDPERWSGLEDGRFVIYDPIRGHRYNVPIVVLQIVSFLYVRESLLNKKMSSLFFPALVLIYLMFFGQKRLEVAGMMVVFMLIGWSSVSSFWKIIVALSATGIGVAYVAFSPAMTQLELASAFGLRWSTFSTIVSFLQEHPMAWVTGAGFLNPLGGTTFQDLYGVNFWPADVGWMGVWFEFGAFGVLLFAAVYVQTLREARSVCTIQKDALVFALRDYVYKILITSVFIPTLPLHTGVVMTLLALLVYRNALPESHLPHR